MALMVACVKVVQVVDDTGAGGDLGMVGAGRNQLEAGLVGDEVVTLIPEAVGQFAADDTLPLGVVPRSCRRRTGTRPLRASRCRAGRAGHRTPRPLRPGRRPP